MRTRGCGCSRSFARGRPHRAALRGSSWSTVRASASPSRRRAMQAQLESTEHPAFSDPRYRARRKHIAALAMRPRIVRVAYTAEEHAVWRLVRARIDPLHEAHACAHVRAAQRALPLSTDAIPQLDDVSRRLAARSGFRL